MKKCSVHLTFAIVAMLCLLVSVSNAQTSAPHIGQFYAAGGGIVVKLSGGHGLCATKIDFMGKCVSYADAKSAKQSCHAGGFSDWQIASKTDLIDNVYPNSNSIPGVVRCSRPNMPGNQEDLYPYCQASDNPLDCLCSYWSSTPASQGGQQLQVSFYTNGSCVKNCPEVGYYCNVILVRSF